MTWINPPWCRLTVHTIHIFNQPLMISPAQPVWHHKYHPDAQHPTERAARNMGFNWHASSHHGWVVISSQSTTEAGITGIPTGEAAADLEAGGGMQPKSQATRGRANMSSWWKSHAGDDGCIGSASPEQYCLAGRLRSSLRRCSFPAVGRAGWQDRLSRPECDLLVDYVSFIFPWRLTGNNHNEAATSPG